MSKFQCLLFALYLKSTIFLLLPVWVSILNYCIVKWGKKWTIPTNLSFYETCQCLNIKINFQAVKIYFLTFSSCFFTSCLQPIRNKLLKTLPIFYPTNRSPIHRWSIKHRHYDNYWTYSHWIFWPNFSFFSIIRTTQFS